jgi:hypothetical protein
MLEFVSAGSLEHERITMQFGSYRINFDALLARIIYRWHIRMIGVALLVIALVGFGSGLIPPIWHGRADLTIAAAPGATIQLDGRSWPRPVYAGQHTVLATLPDGRGSWADIDLQAGQALTLTLPAGLPDPRERALPPAAPGTHIDQVCWADGAWRVTSVQDAPAESKDKRRDDEPTPTAQPGQTVAISSQSVERMATLDAYGGLADQVRIKDQLREAVYRTNLNRGYSGVSLGSIEVRGWGGALQTIPISAPLTLLRFAPTGDALLEAEQVPSGGEQVYLLRPDQPRVPLVAVPGHIVRLSWRPDGPAVVLHSVQGERLTLTLIRLAPTIIAAAVADLEAARYAGAIVPLSWDDAGLLWVAPDQQDVPTLWHAPLTSLIPERNGPMEARALTRLPDGTLRVVAFHGAYVVIGRYVDDIFIGETTVPRVTPAPDLMGIWQGDELLLQGGHQAWLLDVSERR